MRILNVTQTYAPFLEFGGPPVKVRALSEHLVRRGHAVTVLTADWGLAERLRAENRSEKIQSGEFGWTREENGVRAAYLPTRMRYRATSWNPAVKTFCRERIHDFDVAHIFGVYDLLGPSVAAACRANNVPYVVEPIGMLVPIVRSFFLKRMYHLLAGKKMLEGATAVLATSDQEAVEIASTGVSRRKIVLRRNGVEASEKLPERGIFRREHGIPADANMILFLGRLSKKKSPDLLLRAFAMLPGSLEGKETTLVFSGPDEDGMRQRLEELAKELNVAQHVRMTEPIFGEAKWAAYRDADVFVLPSQNENFGNTAAEAAVAGTPVIVTETCGIAPLLSGTAGLVVAHDAKAIANALEKVLTQADLRTQLSVGRTRIAERLGWDAPAGEMETLYEKLVATRSSGA